MPPSTPDQPVFAVRRKNTLHGLCHNKQPVQFGISKTEQAVFNRCPRRLSPESPAKTTEILQVKLIKVMVSPVNKGCSRNLRKSVEKMQRDHFLTIGGIEHQPLCLSRTHMPHAAVLLEQGGILHVTDCRLEHAPDNGPGGSGNWYGPAERLPKQPLRPAEPLFWRGYTGPPPQ